jgi:hypothetical protein
VNFTRLGAFQDHDSTSILGLSTPRGFDAVTDTRKSSEYGMMVVRTLGTDHAKSMMPDSDHLGHPLATRPQITKLCTIDDLAMSYVPLLQTQSMSLDKILHFELVRFA